MGAPCAGWSLRQGQEPRSEAQWDAQEVAKQPRSKVAWKLPGWTCLSKTLVAMTRPRRVAGPAGRRADEL